MKLMEQRGVTLIALVITIIVLLILAGIAISLIIVRNSILIQSKNAKEEYRAGSVEELKNLYINEQTINKELGEKRRDIFKDLLNELENKKLITEEEKQTIIVKKKVTIGSKTIDFSEFKNINCYEEDKLILFLDGQENTKSGHDEKTRIWEDLSKNGNNKKLINFENIQWTDNSLIFDGIDDYIEDFYISESNQMTFQIVLKYEQDGKYRNVYDKYTDRNPMLWIDPKAYVEFNKTYMYTIKEDYSNRIMQFTTTVDADGSYIFLNNRKINQNYGGISDINGRYQLFNRQGRETFKGEVYCLRIYNKVLTNEEIKNSYQIDKYRFNIKDE